MNLPPAKHVDIMAHRYTIKVESTRSGVMSDDELGRCHTTENVILIRDDLPPDAMKDVTLHEIMHAIHFHMELADESSEESFTSRTATGLRTVLVNNPMLCKWIFESETTKKTSKKNATDT